HTYHSRIEFNTRTRLNFTSRFFFCPRRAKRARISERSVRVSQTQNARGKRNLFASQRIGITGAVPPLVMPAHQKLRGAIRADARSFTFANHRMARKVDSFFERQRPRRLNV